MKSSRNDSTLQWPSVFLPFVVKWVASVKFSRNICKMLRCMGFGFLSTKISTSPNESFGSAASFCRGLPQACWSCRRWTHLDIMQSVLSSKHRIAIGTQDSRQLSFASRRTPIASRSSLKSKFFHSFSSAFSIVKTTINRFQLLGRRSWFYDGRDSIGNYVFSWRIVSHDSRVRPIVGLRWLRRRGQKSILHPSELFDDCQIGSKFMWRHTQLLQLEWPRVRVLQILSAGANGTRHLLCG